MVFLILNKVPKEIILFFKQKYVTSFDIVCNIETPEMDFVKTTIF